MTNSAALSSASFLLATGLLVLVGMALHWVFGASELKLPARQARWFRNLGRLSLFGLLATLGVGIASFVLLGGIEGLARDVGLGEAVIVLVLFYLLYGAVFSVSIAVVSLFSTAFPSFSPSRISVVLASAISVLVVTVRGINSTGPAVPFAHWLLELLVLSLIAHLLLAAAFSFGGAPNSSLKRTDQSLRD
jgi:hypothetical protein